MITDADSRECDEIVEAQMKSSYPRFIKHGHSRETKTSSAYMRWGQMVQRCTNPNHPRYADYGGRGITVCERWLDFKNFLADMGEPPEGKVLDRLDNDKGYTKDNCAWVSLAASALNRRSVQKIEFDGKSLTKSEWAKATGLNLSTIYRRLERNLPLAEVFKA